MLLCHARERDRSTHLSCNLSCMALHSSAKDIDQGPNTLYPHAFSDVAAHALAISVVVPVARVRHKETVPLDDKLLSGGPGRGALLLRPPRSSPHPEHELPTTHILQPYCNRAGTHWYTMDKEKPPDHRKPPTQAEFPDAPVQARTWSSKLVMSRSAVRVRSSALYIFSIRRKNVSPAELHLTLHTASVLQPELGQALFYSHKNTSLTL
jgi:hypothetical protein